MFYPLKNYEHRYSISEEGVILDTKTGNEVAHVLTGIPVYKYVNLRLEDGSRKLVRLHRLIAIQFLPNPKNLEMVDHIDGDKLNNKISNLRWVTSSGNQMNKKNNWYIGDRLAISIIYERIGKECKLTYRRVFSRVKRGMSFEDALQLEIEKITCGV